MPKKLTREEFIEQANAIHGEGRYDYSKVIYRNAQTNISIICAKCGAEFSQRPRAHTTNKAGCKLCAHQSFPSNTEDFIRKSQIVHDDKYDYSKVVYKTAKLPVIVLCRDCGTEFSPTPDNHLRGRGCSGCVLKSERACREYIEKIFYAKFPKCKPKWLNRLELDGYNEDIKLAFEYQGRQHVEFIESWHKTRDKFEAQQERDARKKILCQEAQVILLEIPHIYSHYDKPKMHSYIDEQLRRLGFLARIKFID